MLNILPYNMSEMLSQHAKYRSIRADFNTRLPQNDTYIDQIEIAKKLLNEGKKTNVLVIGIDSVSANHFKRVFPRTHEFLSRNLTDSLLFEHFNSVGGNTYPNILAMLTGIVEENVSEQLKSEIDLYRRWDSTFHDHLPYLWHEYEKAGYVTHFQEDDPHIAIFNYYKNGFR